MSYHGPTFFVALCLALAVSTPDADAQTPQPSPDAARLEVETVGKQQILLKSGQHGLAYFPDEASPSSTRSRSPSL